jgi:hypothetical protein
MDEHEWLTSTDPAAMLEALREPLSPNMRRLGAAAGSLISPRKMRLFACACGRELAKNPQSFARLTMAERESFLSANEEYADDAGPRPIGDPGCYLPGSPKLSAQHVASLRDHASKFSQILRCVVGNPFRPVQRWRFAPGDGITLATPTVLALARAAYADRDWGLLPYLADALEEAGCGGLVDCDVCQRNGLPCPHQVPGPGADLLTHLRGPGPFCRGDWALDLLLGKE